MRKIDFFKKVSREDKIKGVFWGWGGGWTQQETLRETKPIDVII